MSFRNAGDVLLNVRVLENGGPFQIGPQMTFTRNERGDVQLSVLLLKSRCHNRKRRNSR